MTTSTETTQKSKGHICFFKNASNGVDSELYKDAGGDLWSAQVSSVIDVNTGYRIGRWEAPSHLAAFALEHFYGIK